MSRLAYQQFDRSDFQADDLGIGRDRDGNVFVFRQWGDHLIRHSGPPTRHHNMRYGEVCEPEVWTRIPADQRALVDRLEHGPRVALIPPLGTMMRVLSAVVAARHGHVCYVAPLPIHASLTRDLHDLGMSDRVTLITPQRLSTSGVPPADSYAVDELHSAKMFINTIEALVRAGGGIILARIPAALDVESGQRVSTALTRGNFKVFLFQLPSPTPMVPTGM